MEDQGFNYKSSTMSVKLSAIAVDIEYLKRLLNIINALTQENADNEINSQRHLHSNDSKWEESIRKLHRVTVQIWGSKGEYLFSDSSKIFERNDLPENINALVFDNSLAYKFSKNVDPKNKIKVEFDFRKGIIFDFNSSPSEATPNNSNITVIGENETWVTGAYNKVLNSLSDYKTGSGWLHECNVYDIFIVLLIFPMSFWLIYRIDISGVLYTFDTSNVFIMAFYVYFFLLSLNIFRIIFRYTRWVYPNIELIKQHNKGSTAHRFFWATLVLGLISGFAYDVLKTLVWIAPK